MFRLPATLGVLALLPGLSWPAADAASKRYPPADSIHRGARARPGPGVAMDRIFPEDAFRNFLREARRYEDSIHYQRGEDAFGQEVFDVALGRHLAADVPAAGKIREDLLAQRSRIFARIWPAGVPADRAVSPNMGRDDDFEEESRKSSFDWEVGTGHSSESFRSGPLFPFGKDGFRSERRYWNYNANARQSRLFPIGKQDLRLALSAHASRSDAMGPSDYAAAIEITVENGLLGNLFLSMTTGLAGSQAMGAYRYHGLTASKAWNFEGLGAYLEAGCSRQWDLGWRRLSDNAWTRISREYQPSIGNSVEVSLAGALTGMTSPAYLYLVPVFYVDDVRRAQPSHFQGPDVREPVAMNTLISSLRTDPHPLQIALNLDAPQTRFSLSPAVGYGLSPLAGWHSRAVAAFDLDIYPEYVWDRVTWPDNLDPYAWDLVGLALNRADGRYYTAVVIEEEGAYREYYGSIPLERRKTRRVDHRAGLDISLARELPHGYFLGAVSSLAMAWSNLPKTAPAALRPWQLGLSVSISRSSPW